MAWYVPYYGVPSDIVANHRLGWTAIVAAEASFFNILVGYWTAGTNFPDAAGRKLDSSTRFAHRTDQSTVTLFVVVSVLIFTMPNKAFAWFEYGSSLVKIFLFIFIIFVSLAIIGGAGAQGAMDGSYWRTLPVFKNGFAVSQLRSRGARWFSNRVTGLLELHIASSVGCG